MQQLFLTLIFATALAEDCSNLPIWIPAIYPIANTQVAQLATSTLYTKPSAWYNTYYAMPEHVPTSGANVEGGPWEFIGICDPGTVPKGEDCSNVTAWTPKTYTSPGELVVHKTMKYQNQYWATEADLPGESGAWLLLSQCDPATSANSTGTVAASAAAFGNHNRAQLAPRSAGGEVDCTGVYKWHPDVIYDVGGEKVYFQHSRYSQKWWITAEAPSQSDAWQLDGPCIAGTDTLGYPAGVGMTVESEEMLCSCCTKCAKINGSSPVCMDDIVDESTCYYAWCPKYNSFNQATCDEIVSEGKLGWYLGEMAEGKPMPDRVFLPYVDVTLANVPNLTEVMQQTGVTHFILAFVVSDPTKCAGMWGGVYDVGPGPMIDGGSTSLYGEINRLRQAGGDVVVSFGGAAGTELAENKVCQSGNPIANLKKQYSELLDLLKLKILDFDIEGPAVDESNRQKGWAYRFAAVKELTQERPDVQIWWTLAVLPSGLVSSGLAFVEDLLAAGVRFDRLNLMTMDYGDAACPNDMHECEIQALTSVAEQVFDIATRLGVAKSYGFSTVEDVYSRLGSTPMVGANDLGLPYTLDNARQSLAVWKSTKPLGVLSIWSLTRDHPCAFSYVDPTCSSGNQQVEDYEYSRIYAAYPN